MALGDKNDFKHNPIDFYDMAIAEIAICMEAQNAFVLALHHYNDEQLNPDNLKNAYRPVLKHIKGSEASRRKPTAILLANNPGAYKDLLNEYSDEIRSILKNLFIVEVAGDRDDDVSGEDSVIHFFKSLDYNIFTEISQELDPEDEDDTEEETPIKPSDIPF